MPDFRSLPFTLRSGTVGDESRTNRVPAAGPAAADFDADTAMDALEHAASGGDEEAAILLGRLLLRLSGRAEAAAHYLDQASRAGSNEASHLLGLIRFRGIAGAPDLVEARRLQTIAARENIPDAWFELSLLLEQGLGGPVEPEEARQWEERAADAGHPRACLNRGARLARAEPPNLAAAMDWYRRAADSGSAEAAARLCKMYLRGEGAPRDEAIAREWFGRAAALGHSWSESEG